MADKGNSGRKKMYLLFGGMIASIVIIVPIVYQIASKYSKKITYEARTFPVGGGGICPLDHFLYDNQGTLHDMWNENYEGAAPLYFVEPEIELDIITPCFDQLEHYLPPEVVIQGEPYYPLVVTADISEEWISEGESTVLTVRAVIAERFNGLGFDSEYPLGISEIEEIKFRLDAPNFVFSPSNEEAKTMPIGLNYVAQYKWVIAPKESAKGEQRLGIWLEGDEFGVPVEIRLDVRNPLGFSPTTISIIAGFGTVVSWGLPIFKELRELKGKKADSGEEKAA